MRRAYLPGLVAIFVAAVLLRASRKTTPYDEVRSYMRVKELILKNYVDEIEERELFYGALDGMFSPLDEYSQFLTPGEMEDLQIDTSGQLGGLGIEVTQDTYHAPPRVVTPLEGSPAFKAGVLAGDVILEIDGESAGGQDLKEIVQKLRGPKGTKVTIKVRHARSAPGGMAAVFYFAGSPAMVAEKVLSIDGREVSGWPEEEMVEHFRSKAGEEVVVRLMPQGKGAEEEIEIVRDIIRLKSVVDARMVDDGLGIAYVRLARFQETSESEVRSAVKELARGGMKGLVLDLRGNPGGLLSSAVGVADLFLDSGVIVSVQGRGEKHSERKEYRARAGSLGGFPVSILIDQGTASASEIVAAALRDHGRAALVGEKSFGKGAVQQVMPLRIGEDEAGAKITTEQYYAPKGETFRRTRDHEWGLEPDCLVELSEEKRIALAAQRRRDWIADNAAAPEESKPVRDPQLEKAVEVVAEEIRSQEGARRPAEALR